MNTVGASNPAPGSGAGAPSVKPEPAHGAAALGRVVAAAKAAHEEHQRSAEDQRAVCDLCEVRRADLRGPCGHKYHAREYWESFCFLEGVVSGVGFGFRVSCLYNYLQVRRCRACRYVVL